MILYSGIDINTKQYRSLPGHFSLQFVSNVQEAIEQNLLAKADVFLLGTNNLNAVKEVQSIYAADKHLSAVILTDPVNYKKVQQSLQFAPFIGKNALVVALSSEVDLKLICNNAAIRTTQKRSFYKILLAENKIAPQSERVKLAQLGSFLEYAPIGALLLSDTDRIENYNQQTKNLFPSLQYLDVELTQLFSKKDAELIRAFIHDEHSPEVKLELNIERRIMEMTSTEVFDEEGEKFFLLLFNDITNQRQEALRIQAILEALPQMAWTTDVNGNAIYFNKGWYFTTGQTREEALGRGWKTAIFPDDLERFASQWKISIETGKPFQQAARYKIVNGEYRWHLTRASAIKDHDQETIMWVGTCTDIHDQILLTEELERKVRERTHSLEASNSELEQFAHVSSHDLQEPLRKIRTFAELLLEGSDLSLNETSKRYLNKISATAERMSTTLKALLNYTKLHREEKFVAVDINEIVAHVLIDLELMIKQKSAVIQVEQLPIIKGIPIQMQQLFYNLINNALKFSHKNIIPRIKITCGQIEAEELKAFPQLNIYKPYCEIVVADNGIGFDQKHAEKIFTIFQRLHSKSEYEGTGIGLSLVKKVIINHRGEIYVVSQPEKGTSFHLILPTS